MDRPREQQVVAPVVAVLTAAGSGLRLGSPLPKALVEVDGVPLVARAAVGLVEAYPFSRLVITAPEGSVAAVADAVRGALAAVPG
ncbi:NTP transferase domain-containing protein, partial [Actinotalea sp. C106]|uniref:NTP transferase domain-containing protein n=1 Tax=Actinotalea sp. C106 TaxID=2908644 RepID=UPI002028D21D